MRYLLIFLLSCLTFNNIFAQFDLDWKKAIPTDSVSQHVDQFDIIDEEILFTLDNKITYLVDTLGSVVWSFDWNSFYTNDYSLQLLKNETSNKIFFVARHNHRDSLDQVGLFEIESGIIWRNYLEGKAHFDSFHAEDFVSFKEGALLIDITSSGNQLIYISDSGTRPFGQKKTDIDSYQNKLSTNGLDRILWVYNNKAHYFDDDGELLSVDSSRVWNVSVVYSSVLMQDETLYHFNSSQIDITDLEFAQDTSIPLPFTYNVFGTPWLEGAADENSDIYFSGFNATGFEDESFAFLVKLDQDNQVVWKHENSDIKDYNGNISNLNISSKRSLYTYDNQVLLLDSDDGKVITQDSLNANEFFMSVNRYQKSLVVDYANNVFYALTFDATDSYISRYKLPLRLGLQHIKNDNSKIFPNPTSDIINLITDHDFDTVEIIKIDGALIYKNSLNSNRINTEGLIDGTYLLRLSNSEGFKVLKFIKH